MCVLGTSCVRIMARCTCFCNLHNKYMCARCCHGKTHCGPIDDCVQLVHANHVLFFWGGELFPTKRHDGTPLDKFRAKVSTCPLHFAAVLLQARGDFGSSTMYVVLCSLELSATLLVAQGQPGWEELLFTCSPSASWRQD